MNLSRMKFFVAIVTAWKLLTIVTKNPNQPMVFNIFAKGFSPNFISYAMSFSIAESVNCFGKKPVQF